jgi:hypothetical protein
MVREALDKSPSLLKRPLHAIHHIWVKREGSCTRMLGCRNSMGSVMSCMLDPINPGPSHEVLRICLLVSISGEGQRLANAEVLNGRYLPITTPTPQVLEDRVR